MKYSFCAAFTLLQLLSMSYAQTAAHPLSIAFQHKAGQEILQPEHHYKNLWGEDLLVRTFKYYVSGIVLKDTKGKTRYHSNETFLVSFTDSASTIITLPAAPFKIGQLCFTLGVDSMMNTNGIQTGVLDPLQGMFWTWNTGYIMAKLDGTSSASKAPGKSFSYHIGGYKAGEQTAKNILLNLTEEQTTNTMKSQVITVVADALKWFAGPHPVRIADTPFCHAPGPLATSIADNYASMFSIQ